MTVGTCVLPIQRHAGLTCQTIGSNTDQLADMLHCAGIDGALDDALVAPLVYRGNGGQTVTIVIVCNLDDLRNCTAV